MSSAGEISLWNAAISLNIILYVILRLSPGRGSEQQAAVARKMTARVIGFESGPV